MPHSRVNGRRHRRVVISGLGVITPIGIGKDAFWQGLQAGTSAVGPVERFDPSPFKCHIAAEVKDFHPADFLEARRVRRLDRFSQFAVSATRLALADAAIDPRKEDPDRIGAMMGTALGGIASAEEEHARYVDGGATAVNPALALMVFAGAASCNIAIEFGLTGPNATNGMSCASGTMAIGDAFRAIRRGEADLMIAGGAEAPLAPLSFGAFSIIRAMSTRNDDPRTASRPFDVGRDGFVMGEGAAVMILEERSRALARGAPIYAEVLGYGTTNDAHHMTAPRPDGRQAARSMRLALDDAAIAPEDVDYVNAHGSSTPLNDPTEVSAVKQALGDHAYRVCVSGTKGYYGHALGASGAIEAAICALSTDRGWMPPTVNLTEPDPSCDLDMVRGAGRAGPIDVALSNSFGFGGINAALVLRRSSA